ncbi:thioredoxin family protein [Candidatus Marinamargulisbacteria bacterium SCGC AG-414-C22]|nr:thioredoxin family protein [Candidatus Marinamargulisbacteria bacterium SCGC AG-414-C22]
MVLLESLQLPMGQPMPSFKLESPSKTVYSNSDLMGDKGLIILFTCNHCPYAKAIWGRVIELAKRVQPAGVNTVAINPNINPGYPADSPENMLKLIHDFDLPFPYLVDKDQQIAKEYQAQCTPDIYVVTPDMRLFYHGRLDDNWQNESRVMSQDLLKAVDCLVQNQPSPSPQFPAMGCSIKWLQ